MCHSADAEPFIGRRWILQGEAYKSHWPLRARVRLSGRGGPERAEECVARCERVLFEKLGSDRLGLALQGLANVHQDR